MWARFGGEGERNELWGRGNVGSMSGGSEVSFLFANRRQHPRVLGPISPELRDLAGMLSRADTGSASRELFPVL